MLTKFDIEDVCDVLINDETKEVRVVVRPSTRIPLFRVIKFFGGENTDFHVYSIKFFVGDYTVSKNHWRTKQPLTGPAREEAIVACGPVFVWIREIFASIRSSKFSSSVTRKDSGEVRVGTFINGSDDFLMSTKIFREDGDRALYSVKFYRGNPKKHLKYWSGKQLGGLERRIFSRLALDGLNALSSLK